MDEQLRERVDALERAVTDGEGEFTAIADGAAMAERIATAERRVDELDDRVAELEAATQALRGYVGNIRSVNRDVEKRADAALAKVESIEASTPSTPDAGTDERSTTPDGGVTTGARPGTVREAPDGRSVDHCRACGRPRREATIEDRQPDGNERSGDPSRTGGSSEQGTLQRVREML